MQHSKSTWVEKLLQSADITINGARPWDITVHNPALYSKVLAQGSLGLGEAYMKGWWDCKELDQFFYRIFLANIPWYSHVSFSVLRDFIRAKMFNLQAVSRSFEVAKKHYDLGNDFFAAMIGKSMTYSCGYWKDVPISSRIRDGHTIGTKDLDAAQFAKLDLVCRKLQLKPGQRILEIGSGWGSFAKYAAENYGVKVVGINVSKEQVAFAEVFCKGLPVSFRLQDYRNINETFDHVVSIAMFEAVGPKNYRTYMGVAKKCLKDNGLFLLHTIGSTLPGGSNDPWINKYIFPNGFLPSLQQITAAVEKLFVIEDVHNFGADYDKTLMAWHKNFEENWFQFKNHYGQTFYRMWRYYLLAFAANFRARSNMQLWQIIFSKEGVPGGYTSIR